MGEFLTRLSEKRRKFLEGLDANEGAINLDIFEDFYPDEAHFVYELLQNAEDAQATEVTFRLRRDGCHFEHNGTRLFNEEDVDSITGIHNSSKKSSGEKIGKFGVGFKSVFVYTLEPEIRSGDFDFRISRLVMPEKLDDDGGDRSVTRFWFPFNNPKKPKDVAYREVGSGLRELAETTLLFLSNIDVINWKIDDGQEGSVLRVEHTQEHVEVLKESGGSTTATSNFLRFSEPVEGFEKQKVALAFNLEPFKDDGAFQAGKPLSEQFKIVPVNGQVAVFFPAEKETSGLRFHLHAPFVPELSRASIKDTPANTPLFDQLASLSITALHGVKDLGFLTQEFLGVLPNPNDRLGARYEGIRENIIEAFNKQPLMPTFAKQHAPAKQLLQAKASLKELLTEDDIEFLIDYNDVAPKWAASRALQGTNVERFMSGLAIGVWDVDDFLQKLASKLDARHWWSLPDAELLDWLAKKSVDWTQQLYALLASDPDTKDELYQLKAVKIVRLIDGTFKVPKECYFPDEKDRYSKIVPCVDRAVLEGGNSQRRKKFAKIFLSEIGVSDIGERQLVEALLEKNYSSSKHAFREKDHVSHLRRFIKLIENDPAAKSTLEKYRIFLSDSGEWHKPKDIFLDTPYLDTGLAEYYEVLGSEKNRAQLHPLYQNLPIDTPKVASLAEALGARTSIQIAKSDCSRNPQWDYLRRVPGERNTSPINSDYVISGFEKLAAKKSVRISRLIWNTMCQPGISGFLEAQYRRNVSSGSHYAKSQLVHQLRNAAWVPQGDSFVRPKAARVEYLPEGFGFDAGWHWIKAIDFGNEVERETEKARAAAAEAEAKKNKKKEAAAEFGFYNPDDLEFLCELSELSENERHEIREVIRRRRVVADPPENEPSNPDRRDQRVREQAKEAQERETEKRSRSVSIGHGAVKQEAKQYLQHQYTDRDGLMICQVCEKPMPFSLDDGTPYFEAVEFLSSDNLSKRHKQNYLALCPNHAAMFRHANASEDIISEMFMELDGDRLGVVLAQEDMTVYFTKTHVADLKSIFRAEEEELKVRNNYSVPREEFPSV